MDLLIWQCKYPGVHPHHPPTPTIKYTTGCCIETPTRQWPIYPKGLRFFLLVPRCLSSDHLMHFPVHTTGGFYYPRHQPQNRCTICFAGNEVREPKCHGNKKLQQVVSTR